MDDMEKIRLVLTRNMKLLRKARKLNQEQLAEKAGLSISFLKDVERGKSWVSPESLEAIARALGVDIGVLFSTEKPEVEPAGPGKVFRMALAIPDNVYELAQGIPHDDDAWEAVAQALEFGHERMKRQRKATSSGSA